MTLIPFRLFEMKFDAGSQMGSNPGGLHTDEATGEKSYVKKYANPDQAKVEALTGKLYGRMGIKTVNPTYHAGGFVKTPWNDHLRQMKPAEFRNLDKKQAHQIGRMYHAAVLSHNWDILGLEHDNVVKNTQTGDLHAVDHGGAFHFRARGGPKEYGPDIADHHSLRHNDQASGEVFSHVFKHHPDVEKASLDGVRNLDMAAVHDDFKNSGLKNHAELHKNFVARREALLAKYD